MPDTDPGLEAATIARTTRRLIPFLFLLFVVNFLDRVNVGFAALQMNADLGLAPDVFGLGLGVFFVGYLIFEIPSNLALQRVGARVWIARIMVSWGVISMAMALTRGPVSFYVLRFLLGVAEAGFVPGVLLLLGQWFPERARAAAVARFMSASAISIVVGAPLSGLILRMGGAMGLTGWQWLFILEGVPAVILGFVCLRFLDDRPADAAWLSVPQRTWLAGTLARETAARQAHGLSSAGAALRNPGVWLLGGIYFCVGIGFYGVSLWMPQIVRQLSGWSPLTIGLVAAVPFLAAAAAMVLNGWHSDRTGERTWHLAGSAMAGAAGFMIGAMAADPVLALLGVSLGAVGIWGCIGVFWSMPMQVLGGTGAAAGIALINSVGNVGGFAGPYLMGVLRARTADFGSGLLMIAGFLMLGCVLAGVLHLRRAERMVPATP